MMQKRRALERRAIGLFLTLGPLACGTSPASTGGPTGAPAPTSAATISGEFVAFTADFDDYRSWHSTRVVDDGGGAAGVHAGTTLIEYINVPAPPPPTPFPEGAVIVKEPESVDASMHQAFAMVKRGGSYNVEGGVSGWEWFELQAGADAGVAIVWRGSAPPQGETYAGNVNGDCNTCHAQALHDGVFAQ